MDTPEKPGKGGQQRAASSAPQGQDVKKPADSSGKAKGGCGCALIGALVIAVSMAAFGSCSGGSDSDSGINEQVRQDEAKDNCHDWVKTKLKSPSSAEFSGDVLTGDQSGYIIAGNVDAENSFGASLRNTWSCNIRLDGDTWRGEANLLGDG